MKSGDAPEYEGKIHTTDAICPYCGHGYQVECEDYSEEQREEECEDCGNMFWVKQVFSVDTRTEPDCELNGRAHSWQSVHLPSGKYHDFCSVCEKCRPIND